MQKRLKILIAVLTTLFILPISINAQTIEPSFPGTIEGTGNHFEITNSEYLNIILDSSEEINLRMESMPEMITMMIEPVSSSSTQFTLSGFVPLTTYYKYQDNYHNLVEFITDENGGYSYTQDLSEPHFVFIQPRSSTKFITDDATGGDCSSIGNWDNITKTCTLTIDVNETIQIDNDGITLDGNNYTLTGINTGSGVYLYGRTGVAIKNINVKNFYYGIYLRNGSNNTLINNNASDNQYGFFLYSSSNNTLNNNTAASNSWFGIYLGHVSQNVLVSNTMTGNKYNFRLSGGNVASSYDNSIDTTNTVDSKPIYYIQNASNQVYDSITNAGVFYCILCDDVTIKDLDLAKNDPGLFFWKTNNSRIENVTANLNNDGIQLEYSDNNVLVNNTASNNFYGGIKLYSSDSNTLDSNIASNNRYGIIIGSSSNNTVLNNLAQENDYFDIWVSANSDSDCDNTIQDNIGSGGRDIKYFSSSVNLENETLSELILCNADGSNINNVIIDGSDSKKNNGILLRRTDNSNITNSESSNNRWGIHIFYKSNNNVIANNVFNSNSYYGIFVSYSDYNTITNNLTSLGNSTGIFLDFSTYNTVDNNTSSQNGYGIYLRYYANDNVIYNNNFINNSTQVRISNDSINNVFNLSLPTGGNYWSDFDEPVEGCNDADSDGFCDVPYTFSGGQDNYPWVSEDGWAVSPILDVPQYYQNVTNTPQDPDWPNETYDSTSNTIAEKGCALASVAMLLNYYGATTTPDTLEPTNPYSLNRWLGETGGYMTSIEELGNIIWGAMDNFSDKESFVKDWETFDCTKGNLEECKNVLNEDLDNGRPVIIYTFDIRSSIYHFVIATGKTDDSWYINDPFERAVTPIKLDDERYQNKILGLRRYKPEPAANFSFLNITLASPAELLIIDSHGRKTGFDPISQTTYNEIPNSLYYYERLDNDETGELGVEIKNIYISAPEDDTYNLQVIGTDTGSYGLSFNNRDINGSSAINILSGITQTDFIVEYSIDYTGVPGEPTVIEHTVIIQDVITEIEIGRELGLIDNDGIKNSIIKKLNNAQKKIDKNQKKPAINILSAFINQVEAQRGKHIDEDFANHLIEDVQFIIENI